VGGHVDARAGRVWRTPARYNTAAQRGRGGGSLGGDVVEHALGLCRKRLGWGTAAGAGGKGRTVGEHPGRWPGGAVGGWWMAGVGNGAENGEAQLRVAIATCSTPH